MLLSHLVRRIGHGDDARRREDVTVDRQLAARFEANRPRLTAVAARLLGSSADAEDAVQEAWLRLTGTDATAIGNLEGWLTTVVARGALDRLRARRRERPLDDAPAEAAAAGPGPEEEAVLADAVAGALAVVLDSLGPAERVAFVLHDVFAVPFEEVAAVVGRSPTAARQLASRARRRVRGGGPPTPPDPARQREVVGAFLGASRDGDLATLLTLLDPDAVLRADAAAVRAGAPAELRGAAAVAATFEGRARVAVPADVDGVPGATWAPGGRPRVVFAFTVRGGRVGEIELLADPATLAELDVTVRGG
jgi:RNA polymerase sigma factor (sigma-70 family)